MLKKVSKFQIPDSRARKFLRFRNDLLDSSYIFAAHIYGISSEQFMFESCYSAVGCLLKYLTDLSYSLEIKEQITIPRSEALTGPNQAR